MQGFTAWYYYTIITCLPACCCYTVFDNQPSRVGKQNRKASEHSCIWCMATEYNIYKFELINYANILIFLCSCVVSSGVDVWKCMFAFKRPTYICWNDEVSFGIITRVPNTHNGVLWQQLS